jgi:hypothetical protein
MEAGMKLIPLGLNARKHKGYFAKVDDEDYEELMKYRWSARYDKKAKCFYAFRSCKGSRTALSMHRVIAEAPRDMQVDHINHDTLDNRRSNLRLCSPSQNHGNQRKLSGASSQYKGVSWIKARKKWVVQIKKDRKLFNLGFFDDEKQAARTYDAAALEFFGEFAYLNFPRQ